MHFRRPRRQRRYTGIGVSFAKSKVGSWSLLRSWVGIAGGVMVAHSHMHRSWSRTGARSWSHQGSISQFHSIRNKSIDGLSEIQMINRYLESYQDPFMRKGIVAYCITRPDLQHITADYLDRVVKLKLFL